jgi:hypothetical protein
MKKLYSLIAISLLIIAGCKKLDETSGEISAQFKLSTGNSAYLTQVVELTPANMGKDQKWTCDFGDGSNTINGSNTTKVSHMYVKGGVYKVTFTAGNQSSSQDIRIYPGFRSYQIKSSLTKELFASTSVGELHTDGHVFGYIKPNTLTDTVYSTNTVNAALSFVVYGVYNAQNQMPYTYRLLKFPPLPQYKHTVIELKNEEEALVTYTQFDHTLTVYMSLGGLLTLQN